MGRVSDWLIEMEEDAFCMTRDEWTAKHGESCIDRWRTASLSVVLAPGTGREN